MMLVWGRGKGLVQMPSHRRLGPFVHMPHVEVQMTTGATNVRRQVLNVLHLEVVSND